MGVTRARAHAFFIVLGKSRPYCTSYVGYSSLKLASLKVQSNHSTEKLRNFVTWYIDDKVRRYLFQLLFHESHISLPALFVGVPGLGVIRPSGQRLFAANSAVFSYPRPDFWADFAWMTGPMTALKVIFKVCSTERF